MITPEQLADLRAGDIVEVTHKEWPKGTVVRGPLVQSKCSPGLLLGCWLIGSLLSEGGKLAVLQKAPAAPVPVYVNAGRTEPVQGDVVRNADDLADARVYLYDAPDSSMPWGTVDGCALRRDQLPKHLRLLVSGFNGQVWHG